MQGPVIGDAELNTDVLGPLRLAASRGGDLRHAGTWLR